MDTIYHLNSAQEVTIPLLDSIKTAYQFRPMTIIVEEATYETDLTSD